MTDASLTVSQVLCITGMHRSGTSLTASWLERCGLPVHGSESHGPATGNPKGHFEDKQFVDLHASAIRAREPETAGWRTSAEEEIPIDREGLETARRLIETRSRKHPVWGWKDPRTVFFLNQWKALLPELRVLLIWRPHDVVTRSLLHRSEAAENPVFKLTPAEARSLWHTHNKMVCAYKRAHPHDSLLVPLDRIIRDDRSVHRAICDRLGFALAYRPLSLVFDNELMSKQGSPGTQGDRAALLERELMALSDLRSDG